MSFDQNPKDVLHRYAELPTELRMMVRERMPMVDRAKWQLHSKVIASEDPNFRKDLKKDYGNIINASKQNTLWNQSLANALSKPVSVQSLKRLALRLLENTWRPLYRATKLVEEDHVDEYDDEDTLYYEQQYKSNRRVAEAQAVETFASMYMMPAKQGLIAYHQANPTMTPEKQALFANMYALLEYITAVIDTNVKDNEIGYNDDYSFDEGFLWANQLMFVEPTYTVKQMINAFKKK